MKDKQIGFIGGGNMAFCLIGGLVNNGFPGDAIWVSNPGEEKRQRLSSRFGVHTTTDNLDVIAHVDVVLICVKPGLVGEVLKEIQKAVQDKQTLVVSVAAGVKLEKFTEHLGSKVSIVRAMPNTPAKVGCGMTALFANPQVNKEEKNLVENIMRAVGTALWLEQEEQIDAATGVAGSGPAYFFLFMEAMQEAGIKFGLKETDSRLLVLETALGAARMALESDQSLHELREEVTSPNGATAKAIEAFQQGNLEQLVYEAVAASKQRAEELSE